MKNIFSLGVIFLCVLMLNACAGNMEQNAPGKEENFPINRDDAAMFLASSQEEDWLPLQQNLNGGDTFWVNPHRVTRYADGVSEIWTKMVFGQAVYSSDLPAPVVTTLMHMQVRCADSTYRSDAWYALGQDGQILEVLAYDMAEFVPLGADSAASRIYQLACIGSNK